MSAEMPLAGRRVMITRAREQASKLRAQLEQLGAEVLEFPAIAIAPPESWTPLEEALQLVAQGVYDWVIFTSVNGVNTVAARLTALQMSPKVFAHVRLAAIGPATAATLQELGLRVDFVPERFVAEAVAEGLGDVRGQRILLARADIARKALPELLRDAGAEVDEVTAYRTVPGEGDTEVLRKLCAGQVDVVTFTSSSTARNFVDRLQQAEVGSVAAVMDGVRVACIGPITANTARAAGLSVDIEAGEYTIPGLVDALIQWAANSQQLTANGQQSTINSQWLEMDR